MSIVFLQCLHKSLSAIKHKTLKLFCLQEAMSLLSCNISFYLWFNQIHQSGKKLLLKSSILIWKYVT